MGTNHIKEKTPKNSKATDLIQQIDVKDTEKKVISNVKHVAINDESKDMKNETNGRLNRRLNVKTNSTEVEYVTSKPLNDESTPIEMKSIPQDNTSTTVDEIPEEEISSAAAPSFRSLISDKVNKLQKVSNAVATAIEPNATIEHNLVLKLIPESAPISIDLNQIPLLGGALSFIHRFKRNTGEVDTGAIHIKMNEDHTVKASNEKTLNKDLKSILLPTRKSFVDNIYNVLELYERIKLACPLSVVINLYTQKVLWKVAEDIVLEVLDQILSSFMIGKENVSDFVSRQLSELSIKLKIVLQMLHEKTKEFIEQLSKNVDAKRCTVS